MTPSKGAEGISLYKHCLESYSTLHNQRSMWCQVNGKWFLKLAGHNDEKEMKTLGCIWKEALATILPAWFALGRYFVQAVSEPLPRLDVPSAEKAHLRGRHWRKCKQGSRVSFCDAAYHDIGAETTSKVDKYCFVNVPTSSALLCLAPHRCFFLSSLICTP